MDVFQQPARFLRSPRFFSLQDELSAFVETCVILKMSGKEDEMSINLEDIKSNAVYVCLYCGKQITAYNYSGWEAFLSDGKTTQPICLFCDFEPDNGEKACVEIAHNRYLE